MKSAFTASTLLAVFLALCEAIPTPEPAYAVHEKRTSTSRVWARGERLSRDVLIPVRIGLSQNNLDDGYAHLMDVSHPESPNFGKHWTPEQVHDMFAPSKEAVEAVRNWLVSFGVEPKTIVQSDNKGWLALDIPTWQAEELFQAEYHEHIHKGTGAVRIGSDEYSIPESISAHIDYVSPGVKLSHSVTKTEIKRSVVGERAVKAPIKKVLASEITEVIPAGAETLPVALQGCGTSITPACLKALYHIPNATRNDTVNNLGIYEDGDIYSKEDLSLFFAEFAPNVPQGTEPTLDSIDGGHAPVEPGSEFNTGESDIDFDISYSLIYPQSIELYQVDDDIEAFEDGGFNTLLDALDGSYCTYTAYGETGDDPNVDPTYPDPAEGGYKGHTACGTFKPTRVISVSYGVSEYDAPVAYTRRQCNEFLKLGLQGTTFVWASGDYGVASFPGDDGDLGCLGDNQTVYNPSFPTCPYVTNVGATRLYPNQTVDDPESALQADLGPGAELFASAGGFANYFPVPEYQKAAVATYFADHDPGLPYYTINENATNIGENGGFYNRIGRGFPDVSANGAELGAYNNETLYHFYGTSLAAPIWGSVITLINQERTAIGKGPVGFINPVLYAFPGVLNDIKNGSNPGCGSEGFSSVEGWDPVTGLGTPNFPSMVALWLALP